MKYLNLVIAAMISGATCYLAWPAVSSLTAPQIQPIASAASTISGVLFGFVMASISLLASAKDNTLVRNTKLTGHLPKLVGKLHFTMGTLLVVCVLFLAVLFVPEALVYQSSESEIGYKYSSILVLAGVFFMIFSFCLFVESWLGFKHFAENM